MNVFSQQLSFFIEKKNVNISRMAAQCGVGRSTMYKIVDGTRRPSSESLVQEICRFLELSPEEASHLMEKYQISQVGEANYRRRQKTLSFLQACFEKPSLPSREQDSPAIPKGDQVRSPYTDACGNGSALPAGDQVHSPYIDACGNGSALQAGERVRSPYTDACGSSSALPAGDQSGASAALTGIDQVLAAASSIILQERQKENGFLSIRMQPRKQCLPLIADMAGSPSLRIQHIVALEDVPASGCCSESNLDLIRALLPTLKQIPKYTVHYFRSNSSMENLDYSLFPFLLLTDDCALQASGDLRFGVLHRNQEAVALFRKLFQELLGACLTMAKETLDYREALVSGRKRYTGHSAISFQSFPRMSFLLTKELLQKYIRHELPDRCFVLNAILERTERESRYFRDHSVTILASEKGLRAFLNSGSLSEHLSVLYEPPALQDRLLLLRRFRDKILQYGIRFRLVRESFGNTDSYCSIWIEENEASIILSGSRMVCSTLSIREPDLLSCFLDFFSNLPSHLFYSEKESLEILERILEEAE